MMAALSHSLNQLNITHDTGTQRYQTKPPLHVIVISTVHYDYLVRKGSFDELFNRQIANTFRKS